MTIHFSSSWYIAVFVSSIICLVLPIFLAWKVNKRFDIKWTGFFIGALVFFLFSFVIQGIVDGIQQYYSLGASNLSLLWFLFSEASLIVLMLGCQYLSFRFFYKGTEQQTWNEGIMYGLGFGGISSMLTSGIYGLLRIPAAMSYEGTADNLKDPKIHDQFLVLQNNANIPAWQFLMVGAIFIMMMFVYIACSLLVLRAFSSKDNKWYIAAFIECFAATVTAFIFVPYIVYESFGTLVLELFNIVWLVLAIHVILQLRENVSTLKEMLTQDAFRQSFQTCEKLIRNWITSVKELPMRSQKNK
jgi:uncharacterized membrane protein YhfC